MNLYQIARWCNTISNPTPKQLRNIAVGRALGKAGFWRWLWK